MDKALEYHLETLALHAGQQVDSDALQPCGRRKTVSPIIFGTSCLDEVY